MKMRCVFSVVAEGSLKPVLFAIIVRPVIAKPTLHSPYGYALDLQLTEPPTG